MEATIDQSVPKFSLNIEQNLKGKDFKDHIKAEDKKDKKPADKKSYSLSVDTKDDQRVRRKILRKQKIN